MSSASFSSVSDLIGMTSDLLQLHVRKLTSFDSSDNLLLLKEAVCVRVNLSTVSIAMKLQVVMILPRGSRYMLKNSGPRTEP